MANEETVAAEATEEGVEVVKAETPPTPARAALNEHMAKLRNGPVYRDPVASMIGLATVKVGDDEQIEKVFDVTQIHTNCGKEGLGSMAVMAEALQVDIWHTAMHVPSKTEWLKMLITMRAGLREDPAGQHANAEAIREVLGLVGDDWGESLQTMTGHGFQTRGANSMFVRHPTVEQYRIVPVIIVLTDLMEEPRGRADLWLRLTLLSNRQVQPHNVDMTNAFNIMESLVWTDEGPFEPAEYEKLKRYRLRAGNRPPAMNLVDKFPRMLDYVIPDGVRIADANRVRMGAHLAEGTTVMHEGFCNFNAGTLGASMVEGRISAGVVVGDGSDVGGGASIMGTLSGGGTQTISVGKNCLLGANSGLGISLGDDCIVEAGLYLTAGTRVTMPDCEVVKALNLSGVNGMLFRRDSEMGHVEAIERTGDANWQGLNPELHKN